MSFKWTTKNTPDTPIINYGDIVSDDQTPSEWIDIAKIYSIRREHESEGEQYFIDQYMKDFTPIKDIKGEVIAYRYENLNAQSKNNILWTSHIDTVHWSDKERIKQDVYIDSFGTAFVDEQQDCLGADDGSGVWLMLEMIKANCFGTFIFFRGEEQGCIGSTAFAEENEDYLKGFTCAIAFDRKGTTDVITHQRSSECCSSEFAKGLSKVLGMKYKPDNTGVYTDTAEFMHLIPEITNLSVGYVNQHSHRETQDLKFLVELRDRLISIDWASADLPVKRVPEKPISSFGGWAYGGDYSGYRGSNWDYDWADRQIGYGKEFNHYDYEDFAYMSESEIERFLKGKTNQKIARLIKLMAEDIVAIQESYY